MPELPEPSPAKPSRLSDRLFILWVGVGVLLVALSLDGSSRCPARPRGHPTFRVVGVEQAVYDAYDGWVEHLTLLRTLAIIVGALGALVFFRRGCVVFVFAGGVIVICEMVVVGATWVDL